MTKERPTIAGYELQREIGSGGNADIWQAIGPGNQLVAIKVLRTINPNRESYRRFQREVQEHAQLTKDSFPGILPLLDHRLPERPSLQNPAWLATPIALELATALGDRPMLETVVQALAAIADTLARLHARGLAHRDVKPPNCYRYEGEWVIGDFGLIQSAEAETSLTVGAKALGPRNFIAPEMLIHPDQADGAAADVYSLGKTLFALAAGLPVPPIGEHRADLPSKRLRDWGVTHPRAFYLDRLIEQMTRELPQERPSMASVAHTLRTWAATPPARDISELRVDDIVNAIGDLLQQGDAVRVRRQRYETEATQVASELAKRMPEIVARLRAANIPNSGITAEFAGVAEVMRAEMDARAIAAAEVAVWRSCGVQISTAAGAYGSLRFGVGAALCQRNLVVIVSTYHLADRSGNRTLWKDADAALLGSAELEDKVSRLADGLIGNLQMALVEFYKAIEG